MIIKEQIGIGSTVDEAREDAILKLGAGIEDDVKFDIIALPKKKTLGLFGGSDAKVRAYIEGPDAPVAKERKERGPKLAEKKNNHKKEVAEKKPAEAKVVEVKGVPAAEVDPESQAGRAYIYLAKILEKMGVPDFSAEIAEIEGGAKITIGSGNKLGVMIGRRGETLDALQYLASLVANEKGSGYYRVVIDICNYRERREGTLEALAKRTAAQVLKTGRNRALEPMNPYERRIIHTAIQEIEGVVSASVGDGAARRVVIAVEGKPIRDNGGRPQRNGSRRGRDASRRSSAPQKPVQAENNKPKETDGTKLYGRLDK